MYIKLVHIHKDKCRIIHAEDWLFQGTEIGQGCEEVRRREIISFL